MHMVDALLSPGTGAAMWAASAGAAVYATKKITGSGMSEKKLPVMAVSGAFVFAAQMINFTIPGTGSSGHIGGGIMLAGLLGEFPAFLTLAAVLLIQCLFFADGGLLAWGANVFNMAVIPCLIVYPLVMRPLLRKGITKAKLAGSSLLASVIGLQLGAFGVVLETQLSGITELPFAAFAALMQPVHLAIGVVEGLVTAAVLGFVWRLRPELIEAPLQREKLRREIPVKKVTVLLAIAAVVIGGVVSLAASSNPDGLEWSMEHTAGTSELKAENGIYSLVSGIQDKLAFLPDYDFSDGEGTGTSLSGVVGAALTALLALGIGGGITVVKRRKRRESYGGHEK